MISWLWKNSLPLQGTDITDITVTKGEDSKHFIKKKLDDEKGTIEWYKDSADSKENKVEDNSPLNVLADFPQQSEGKELSQIIM